MIVAHGQCGKQWTQIGNRTGHCSGCHETFSGLSAFDAHQSVVDDRNVCKKPENAGLVARPDRNIPDLMIWGQKGAPPGEIWGTPDTEEEEQ